MTKRTYIGLLLLLTSSVCVLAASNDPAIYKHKEDICPEVHILQKELYDVPDNQVKIWKDHNDLQWKVRVPQGVKTNPLMLHGFYYAQWYEKSNKLVCIYGVEGGKQKINVDGDFKVKEPDTIPWRHAEKIKNMMECRAYGRPDLCGFETI